MDRLQRTARTSQWLVRFDGSLRPVRLGLGSLFGSAHVGWSPLVPHWAPWLQAVLVLIGQAAGLKAGWLETRVLYQTDRQAVAGYAPTAALVTITTLVLLALYAG